jgi:hypothetical protein
VTLSPALIWNAASIALAIIAIAGFLWAKPWDRAKGRLRCPKCWYDMKGIADASPDPPWTCSECGRILNKHKHLRRTRRRLVVAIPCVVALLLALYGWTARDRVIARGWIGAIPTIALAAFAPMDDATWKAQVSARMAFPSRFTNIRINGQAITTPPTPTPGFTLRDRLLAELLFRLDIGDASQVSWRIAMSRAIGPMNSSTGFTFRSRAEWPRDVEAWVFVDLPDRFAPLSNTLLVRVRQVGDADWSTIGVSRILGSTSTGPMRMWATARPSQCSLGTTKGDSITIEIELLAAKMLSVNQGNGRFTFGAANHYVVWRGRTQIARVVDRSAHSMMSPFVSEAADARVAASMTPAPVLSPYQDGVGIRIAPRSSRRSGPSEFAIGLRLEVLRDGEVVATGTHALQNLTSRWEHDPYAPLRWIINPPTASNMGLHEWRLRVTGDPEVALRDYETNTYWSGSLSMPIIEFEGP